MSKKSNQEIKITVINPNSNSEVEKVLKQIIIEKLLTLNNSKIAEA